MLNIPYEAQKDFNACALACYTMVARYFFPEVTAEQMTKIAGWEPGYVVWSFKFWLWLADKGIRIEDYDIMDCEAWASNGIEGLRNSVPQSEFEFYTANTKDLNSYAVDIQAIFANKNFTYHRERPKLETILNALENKKVCEITLNSGILNNEKEFNMHRVVVLDINKNDVIVHDPDRGPYFKIPREIFLQAWLGETTPEPELCIYERI